MTQFQRLQILGCLFLVASSVAATAHAWEPVAEAPLPMPAALAAFAAPPATMLPADRGSALPQPSAHSGDNFMAHSLTLYGQMSLGGPYGLFGGSVDESLARYVSVEAGAGLTPSASWEFSAMVHPRLPLSPGFAIGAGLGLGAAPNWAMALDCAWGEGECTQRRWSFASFLNGELDIEGRTRSGFSVRGYIGDWKILDPMPDRCEGACWPLKAKIQPYFGVAFGASMDL